MPKSLSISSSPTFSLPLTNTVGTSVSITSKPNRPRRSRRTRRRGRSTTKSGLAQYGIGGGGFGTGIAISSNGAGTTIGVGIGLNISSRGITIKGAPGLSSAALVKTGESIALAAAKRAGLDLNMSPAKALDTLAPDLRRDITNAVSGQISQAISGISFPSLQFPGMGQVSIVIGAGPKWLADQLLKYKTIVPPFVPGLKINMAMVSAALSIIRAAASGNLGAIAKSILEDMLEDIKEQSGLADLEDQVKDQIAEVQGAIDSVKDIAKNGLNVQLTATANIIDNAESGYVDQYNRENPPQTIINDNGETETINPPPANTSLYSGLRNSVSGLGSDLDRSVSQLGSNIGNAISQLGTNVSNMSSNTTTPPTPTSPPTG